MKKILSIVGALAVAAGAYGQGFILTQGGSASVLTNNLSGNAPGALASGKTSTAATGFYYALLFSTSSMTGANPSTAGWTVATLLGGGQLLINNYNLLAGGVNGSGASAGVAVNMAASTPYNVELVGWSSSLGGQASLANILTEYSTSTWTTAGYFGFTSVATMTPFATAGAGDPALFPTTWANNTLSLNSVPVVPEPGTLALAALGGASLLMFRRRK